MVRLIPFHFRHREDDCSTLPFSVITRHYCIMVQGRTVATPYRGVPDPCLPAICPLMDGGLMSVPSRLCYRVWGTVAGAMSAFMYLYIVEGQFYNDMSYMRTLILRCLQTGKFKSVIDVRSVFIRAVWLNAWGRERMMDTLMNYSCMILGVHLDPLWRG